LINQYTTKPLFCSTFLIASVTQLLIDCFTVFYSDRFSEGEVPWRM